MPPASIKRILVLALAAAVIVALLWLMEFSISSRVSKEDAAGAAETNCISIITKSGWSLRLFPDGSGLFGYGFNLADGSLIPAGTYHFPAIYRDMRRIVHADGSERDCEVVSFLRSGSSVASNQYTKETAVLRPLFETAMQKRKTFPGDRLDEIWKDQPPF